MISSLILALLAQTDVSVVRDNLWLFGDGGGHYLVLDELTDPRAPRIFYGDSKTFYQISLVSYSLHPTTDVVFYDQRYLGTNSRILGTEDSLVVSCAKRKATFARTLAPPSDLLAKAAFKRTPMEMRAYALARDDHGIYYYVDRGRFDDNQEKFRVFVGPRGNMKEQKLKNIVHDSGGDIFATPTGDLRLVLGADPTSEWVAKDRHTKLLSLPINDNLLMIMTDLGVYSHVRFGTPCDDI